MLLPLALTPPLLALPPPPLPRMMLLRWLIRSGCCVATKLSEITTSSSSSSSESSPEKPKPFRMVCDCRSGLARPPVRSAGLLAPTVSLDGGVVLLALLLLPLALVLALLPILIAALLAAGGVLAVEAGAGTVGEAARSGVTLSGVPAARVPNGATRLPRRVSAAYHAGERAPASPARAGCDTLPRLTELAESKLPDALAPLSLNCRCEPTEDDKKLSVDDFWSSHAGPFSSSSSSSSRNNADVMSMPKKSLGFGGAVAAKRLISTCVVSRFSRP